MKQSINVRFHGVCAVLFAAGVLAGCASMGDAQAPEAAVTQRSADYWKARLSGDVDKAYALTSPGYRAINDREKYRLSYGAVPVLQGGEVVTLECQPDRCDVRKNFVTYVPLMKDTPVPLIVKEIWIKDEGQWWLMPQ
ncbi:hypothetical protein IAE26_22765 [Delftia sp. S67]|nr:hypothetical protein [Delftia sp. S67]MBK0113247.1 hypothetical protein [Delftia sp. S65]MBK0120677.1 hypothetical protein [Delftia sp. S67]MBK0132314.1 hypothetical protein [Delftia sp. S66]